MKPKYVYKIVEETSPNVWKSISGHCAMSVDYKLGSWTRRQKRYGPLFVLDTEEHARAAEFSSLWSGHVFRILKCEYYGLSKSCLANECFRFVYCLTDAWEDKNKRIYAKNCAENCGYLGSLFALAVKPVEIIL